MNHEFAAVEPARAAIDAESLMSPLLLEFGTPWCPHCQRIQPLLHDTLSRYPQLTHHKIEDGPGKPLGRSFRVKLWPTLIVMKDGAEVARLVRPTDAGAIGDVLARMAS